MWHNNSITTAVIIALISAGKEYNEIMNNQYKYFVCQQYLASAVIGFEMFFGSTRGSSN